MDDYYRFTSNEESSDLYTARKKKMAEKTTREVQKEVQQDFPAQALHAVLWSSNEKNSKKKKMQHENF